jgi:hypothetical protein
MTPRAAEALPPEPVRVVRVREGLSVGCSRCHWTRTFATVDGARQRLCEHMLAIHRVSLYLPRGEMR